MRRLLTVAVILLSTSVLLSGYAVKTGASAPLGVTRSAPARAVTEADNDFGFRLLSKLDKGPASGNVFFSPLSVSSALMMTVNGAGGQTKKEMADALGLAGANLSSVNRGYGFLLPYLRSPDGKVDLSIANALWVQSRIHFAPKFQKLCASVYGAQTTSLDLHAPSGAARINRWVGSNTHGKITQIVSSEALRSAVAVLTDAIYFHGQWTTQFDKAATKSGTFRLESGTTRQTPLMSQTDSFPYLDNNSFQAIAMPYGTGRVSLYVLLPRKGTSIEKLAGTLNRKSWDQWMKQFSESRVHITLPRFHADFSTTLNRPLIVLGMTGAFDPKRADFEPMGLGRKIYISDVLHKTTLDVDEKGTTAAAATAVIMVPTSAMIEQPPTIEMRVDHPFFCAIRDNTTGAILFEGVIRDPK